MMDNIWVFISHLEKNYQKLGVIIPPQHTEVDVDGMKYFKLNIILSELLIKRSKRSWYLTISDFIKEIVEQSPDEIIVFDEFELLMSPDVGINFLELLLELSKVRVILIIWRYDIDGTTLIYAKPGHKEYRRFKIKEEQIFFG